MNPKVIDGVLLIWGFLCITIGIGIRYGFAFALIYFGIMLILRLIAPPLYALLRREKPDE